MLASLALAVALAASPGPPGSPDDPTGWQRIYPRLDTWDLSLDVGCRARWACGGQVRTGYLWVREPTIWALGPVARLWQGEAPALGLEGEVLRIDTALWGAVGATWRPAPGRAALRVALGVSHLGLELTRDLTGPQRFTVALVLHVPLRMLLGWGVPRLPGARTVE
jgi:hypothetical protein